MNEDKLQEKIKSLEARLSKIEKFLKPQMEEKENFDASINEAIRLITQYDTVSASFLQRKLSIGYARACRILDQLEEQGYVSEAKDGQPRRVYKKA